MLGKCRDFRQCRLLDRGEMPRQLGGACDRCAFRERRFTGRVSATSVDLERRYCAHVRSDGLYFFLDLPAGNYVLSGKDERGRPIENKPVSIPPASGPGMLPVLGVDLIAQANLGQIAESSMVTGQRSAPARRRRQSNEERG